MSSLLDATQSLLPYHLMSYGTLLGFQLYQVRPNDKAIAGDSLVPNPSPDQTPAQSFINTKLCFRHLPLPQFTQLQKRIFPVYFQSLVGLILLTAATHPPHSFASLGTDYAGLASLSTALAVDALNWSVYGPKTTQAMVMRAQQGRLFCLRIYSCAAATIADWRRRNKRRPQPSGSRPQKPRDEGARP